MILNDKRIKELAELGMISPFFDRQVRGVEGEELDSDRVISYGLSSFGYDIRLAPEFKIVSNHRSGIIDPKRVSDNHYLDINEKSCIIPPSGFVLSRSIEKLEIPDNILVLCVGKSTYARCGIIVNVTPLEPGWRGYITLEIHNTTVMPAKVYANEGICQLLFFQGETCETSYGTRMGKYQDQTGIVLPRL